MDTDPDRRQITAVTTAETMTSLPDRPTDRRLPSGPGAGRLGKTPQRQPDDTVRDKPWRNGAGIRKHGERTSAAETIPARRSFFSRGCVVPAGAFISPSTTGQRVSGSGSGLGNGKRQGDDLALFEFELDSAFGAGVWLENGEFYSRASHPAPRCGGRSCAVGSGRAAGAGHLEKVCRPRPASGREVS